MKVGQLGHVLSSSSQLYRDSGNVEAALALDEMHRLLAGREAMTVANFLKLLGTAISTAPAPQQ